MARSPAWQLDWRERLQREALGRVLPWWRREMYDPAGGHHGGRDHDGRLRDDLPRSAVLGTRLLWTFAEAARRDPAGGWLAQARHYHDWLCHALWDPVHGGVHWHVDGQGRVLDDHKQVYAQGFAIYALAAWHRASGDAQALQRARDLFERLDDSARDPVHGGYFEGCARDWQVLPDARLSAKEPRAAKSMNTLLHLLEGCTELLRLQPERRLAARVRELVLLFLQCVWQPQGVYFGLFFEADWRCLSHQVSYGHDIEAAWLLVRAAEVLGDPELLRRCRQLSIQVAQAVLRHGVAEDGSLLHEGLWRGPGGAAHVLTNDQRHWWPQAEAMVGFWDAWQHGGDERCSQASWRVWCWIEQHLCDAEVGEWRKVLDAQGRLLPQVPRAGPWECPYHHVRACFELMDRLAAQAPRP